MPFTAIDATRQIRRGSGFELPLEAGGTGRIDGLGRGVLIPVVNRTDSTISAGSVVKMTGEDLGGTGVLGVEPVSATSHIPVGVALDDIAARSAGLIVQMGIVTVLVTGTVAAGNLLYPSSTSGTAQATTTGAAIGIALTADSSGEAQVLLALTTGQAISGVFVTAVDGGKETISTDTDSGAAATLDLADGNVHQLTLTADCTITLTGATDGKACSMTLLLVQDSTGSRIVTWPAAVNWPDDTAPTLSTDADGVDIITLLTLDGGTTWYGSYAGSGSVVAALDDLSDVTITTPTLGDRMRYDGSGWVNDDRRWVPMTIDPDADGTWQLLFTDDGDVYMTEVS